MQSTAQGIASLVGRVFLATIFLLSAVGNKIPNFEGTVAYMESKGMPMPQLMLVGAIAFLVLGSLSIISGFQTRTGATMLLIFLILATYYFHDFWNYGPDDLWISSHDETVTQPKAMVEQINFMKNLSMAGAMIFLIANGGGAWSVDECWGKKSQTGETEAA